MQKLKTVSYHVNMPIDMIDLRSPNVHSKKNISEFFFFENYLSEAYICNSVCLNKIA